MTSDTNSLSSSRHTNKFYIGNCTMTKQDNSATDSSSKTKKDLPNPNIITIHRQQYRSNNSVTTYNTDTSNPVCMEMFYNPHQSGVARKFFKRQRRYTKNNLGSRKPGDGGATSDGGSCVSIPRRAVKLDNDIEKEVLGRSSTKVNNTNIHVESCERIGDVKNSKIMAEVPEHDQNRVIKKVNNCAQKQQNATNDCQSTCGSSCDLHSKSTNEEGPQQLRNVSQQCTLDCSSELDLITQIMSENDASEMSDMMTRFKESASAECLNGHVDKERLLGRYAYSSGNLVLYSRPTSTPMRSRSCNSSLNDVYSLSKSSKTDNFVPSTSSSNFFDKAPCSNNEDDENSLVPDNLDEVEQFLEEKVYAVVLPNAGLIDCNADFRSVVNCVNGKGNGMDEGKDGYDSDDEKKETSV